ncbi:MAG: hypothetical protein WA160_14600 [Pseudobdellovibrio sp.]
MTKKIIFALLIHLGSNCYAKAKIDNLSLKEISLNALQYALDSQIQTTLDSNYLKGEWPTQIQSTLIPSLVGVGRMFGKDQEATAFTTASVINILSQTYLDNPELANEFPLNKIPNAIQQGVSTFSRYKSDDTFNFYPPLRVKDQVAHRPINMTLFPIWFGFTNVPNDADTTSAALAALVFNSKINNVNYEVPQKALEEFAKYRDVNRSPMFYNKRLHRKQTGGFMTWLYDEKNPDMPRFYFASTNKGKRIPFNKNDVDCVVNSNVLRLLALTKKQDLSGRSEACQMLNDMIEKDEHATCGVYYPNTLNLSFVIASAEKAGENCISDKSHESIIKKIVEMQNADGSWQNDNNIWKDPVLTTAFALYSLLHYVDRNDQRVNNSLIYGTHYLLAVIKNKNSQLYWTSDNFFTATAIARSLIMWRSKAYTNSIISSVLLEMNKRFPSYTAKNYLQIKFE